MTPHQLVLPLGAAANITVTTVNAAQNNAPINGNTEDIQVASGPNQGLDLGSPVSSNNRGQQTFAYTSSKQGTDTIYGYAFDYNTSSVNFSAPDDAVQVTWQGGPDLVIRFLTPHQFNWDGKHPILVHESTLNQGTTTAGASTTRYYFSTMPDFDPAVDRPIGQRSVPTLLPNISNDNQSINVLLPADTTPGTYYMHACADADHVVVETNETNNCQVNEVSVALKRVPLPDCSHAGPTIHSLWPPNHKMVTVGIAGVTDPNKFSFTITVTKIQQDEPVESPGSGHTEPDGAGIGASTAQVRAERSGTGTGRIYFIGFEAVNSQGGACTGTVQVDVPHDQGQGSVPIDTGQRYDSTQP